MKIIAPYQISSEILNIINEANQYLILVSPYVNFTNWDRVKIDILNAKKRGVKIIFYTRNDKDNFKSWQQIELLGITPNLISGLHAKLYFNESKGIVTSMNLLASSSMNSLEFGSIYESENELAELKKYIRQYLEPNVTVEIPNDEDLYLSKERFIIVFQNYISSSINKRIFCKQINGGYSFNARNQFFMILDKVRNNLFISTPLSNIETDNFNQFINNLVFDDINVELKKSDNEGYLPVVELYYSKNFTNSNFDYLQVIEKKKVLDIALCFISDVNNFKQKIYFQSKKGR